MSVTFPILFEPHRDLLLDRLSARIDESMLREIAEADYGSRTAEHHAALRQIRDEGLVPGPDWVPMEVLELIRWSEPDQPEWKPGRYGNDGHWMRAFCCASLLRMAGEKDMGAHASFNATVAGLIASLDALDAGFWTEAGSFLTWFVNRATDAGYHDEDAFFGVALLLCALRTEGASDAEIAALCKWTFEREEAERLAQTTDGWLHRTSFHDRRRETWRMLGGKMAALDLRPRSRDAQEWVGLIVTALAEAG